MKKTTLRQAAMKLAIVAIALFAPLGLRAQTTQTFDFEDNAIPSAWTNDATYPWVVVSESQGSGHSGTYCIKSGNSGVSSSSSTISATFTFNDDGTISFLGGCFGEGTSSAWDKCIFSIDGTQQFAYGARQTWETYTFNVAAGEHTFTWSFTKDGSVNAAGDAFFVDDIVVDLGEVPAFPKPTNLAVSNISHNSATLNWNENGTATSWQICVNNDESNPITTSTKPYELTGLTALTAYTVKVRAIAGSDNSDWTNNVSFSTTAEAVAVGDSWSDDFEGESCGWELVNGTLTNQWAWGTAANNGGTHGLYISNDGGTSNAYSHSAAIVYATKLLNFTEGKYEFSYDWKANGESNYDYLRVALVPASVTLTAGTTPSEFSTTGLPSSWIALDGGNKLNLVTAWQSKSLAINVTAGNYYLVMAWKNDGGGGTQPPAAVDNVSITRVACPYDVAGLAVANDPAVTQTTATVTWTAGEATQWQVATKTGDANWSTLPTIYSTNNAALTGLTAATTYQVKVRAYCNANDQGTWCEPISFTTACPEYAEVPFTENFDGMTGVTSGSTNKLPVCWNYINTTENSSYQGYPVVYNGSSYSNSGNNHLRLLSYAYYGYSGTTTSDPKPQYAVLPAIDNINGLRLKLHARAYNTSSSSSNYDATFKVGIMTDPTDANTFVEIAEKTPTTTNYEQYIIPFNGYTGSGNYIAIMVEAAEGSGTYATFYKSVLIDDITVEEIPTCVEPTDLDVTANVQAATVTWTSDGNSWQVFQSTTATAEPDGDNAETAGETSFTTDDLTLGDHYFWVRANCGSDGYSEWAGPVSVHIGYCVPTPSNVDGNGISNVTFGTGDNIVNNNTPKATYADYNSEIGAVQAGVESTIAITYATGYTYGTIIWVDFDNSLSFEDNEIVYMGTSTGDNPTTLNATITIPATQATGDYRMRVGGADDGFDDYIGGSSTTAPDACYTGNWACFQDYTLRVLEAPSCLPASDVTVGNVTATSAVVSWTNNNDDETTYTVKQGENVLTTTAVDSYTINGLTAATTYPAGTYTIVSNCDETAVANVPAFTTECEAIDLSTLDFSENFDDCSAVSAYTPTERVLPICWKAINTCTNSSYKYYPVVSSYSSSSYAHSGSNYLKFYSAYNSYYEYDPQDQYAILPEMDGLAGKQVTLMACGYNTSSTFKIGTMSDPTDASTFEMIAEQTLTTTYPTEPFEYIIPTTCTDGYLAIMMEAANSSNSTKGVYIDDIAITDAPTCIKPTNLEVTASGLNVTFTWTSEVGSYEIAHTTDATANPDENVAGTATELTFTMNNIALGDHYFWVRANCGSDGYSEWAGPVSVHIGYCVPTPSNVDGNGISNVTFGMGDNIVNNNTPKATYADYNSEIGAVQAGVESTIAITYATGYTYGTIIWVDFDNSLSFEDNEIVYMGTSTEDNPTTLNATITIPATQATGDYRMRVGGSDSGFDNFINGSSTSAPSACYTGNWACFQDYTLRVLEAPSCLPASDVTVGNVTATSAVISWTNNNDDETTYTVKQGENVLTTTAVDSYIINGLTAATTYPAGTYTIVSNCDETAVANVPAFTTECDVVVVDADHPFFEGFEGTTFAPTCWENVNSGSYAWTGSTYQHHNGSACAYSGYNGDIYLKMPEIQISNTLTAPQLTFWSYNTYSSDYDKNSVVLIDGTNETELWSPNSVSQSWEKSTIDLTPYIGQTIRLAFKYEGSNAHGWYIDDVKIEEYHVDKDIEANKWYAISSPVHNSGDNETLAGVTNLTTAADEFDYDLYGYTESAGTWNAPTILEQGKGYIYRRSSNTTLNFVGTPNNSVPAYTLSYACGDNDLKGFNLVGNPYPDEANPDMDCYKLTPAGTWKVKASDENVDVCEAVLVYTDGSNATVSFSAPTPSKSSSDHTALAFTVSNDEFEDVAYARFDNGEGLPKIGHLAANAPMLSIPVEGRRYAIANLGSDCQSFDMVFRGTGTYTLSFSGNSSYCHLIDRVAGKDIDMLRQNYTFSSNGFDADRFTVKLSPDAQENAGSNFAYWNGNVWMVEGNGTLQVFDALGRQLLSQEISNSNFEIQNSLFPAAGVYVLRMGEKTQKIVVR